MNIDILNQHLFRQLERLDGNLSEDELQHESTRSKSINDIAGTILASAKLTLEAARFRTEVTGQNSVNLPMLESERQGDVS